MGIQLVVSLLAASIMQRMAPHASFARWLLCNGRYILVLNSQVIHYMHNLLGTVYIHVSVIPSSLFRFKHPSEGELCALAGKQMPKPNRRDRWESGDGMTQIRVPGEARHCLNHKSNVPLIYFLSYYFLLQSSCSTSVFLLSVTEKQTRPLFIFYNFFVWFLGDRTGRISLSRCPKTSTFTWRKLQSTLLTLLVKQTFFYLHHNDAVEVQTRLEHNCWLTTNPPMHLLYLHFFYNPLRSSKLPNVFFSCSYFQCCAFSWSISGW